ncbi:hypothetical protein [Coxiella burnetii]|uniref:Uncharacterized protein n=2 Tax=Coxiella burnetii TaxID=777 RepID=Q83D59_COXBU|nr:hypothetical protein [Coxiella burnetii]NP_819900.1 hypothetical protein CBU_0883 [Coxiella burnetii RSA 493]AAO90414.1 hypothetical protein CBU_0883 [Coxiella burnetii RSA 493]ABS77945.1 hypothetical protein CBUD_0947 [Coxiella burnetii Dugway 5J108-111]ABX78302.1 hypothetical protein COXBURSA331_A1064 [Coxiella burnetii RSA 331]ACJ18456.1 hypothetical protein CbuG_1119 [Coxiella burnetii CbuG_Q212]ACJ20003.1 hypothetical protein CbuK_0748 [Coxiella burnetii CbuK_Q154]
MLFDKTFNTEIAVFIGDIEMPIDPKKGLCGKITPCTYELTGCIR